MFDFEKSSTETNEKNIINQINPNSIDLTLDRKIMRMKENSYVIYGQNTEDFWEIINSEYDDLYLAPNECVLCCTREYVIMPPDLCGQLFTKSTLGRTFVNHMMAGVIDAGFHGRITLEFKNDSNNNISIPFGSRVVQLVYSELCTPAKKPYDVRNSRYNLATSCEPPKEERMNYFVKT